MDAVMSMRRRGRRSTQVVIGLLLGTLLAIPMARADDLEKDPVYRALLDEMNRGVERLQMEDLERPYYLEYTVLDSEDASASASFGALVNSSVGRGRRLITDLRVGDYAFDNTNFAAGRFGGGGSLPLDDDYDAIRHSIWLATDRAYKGAVSALARKRAVIKTRNIQDQPDDFSKVKPNVHVSDRISLEEDREKWEGTVRRLSAIFREFPAIQDSTVSWGAGVTNQYFINSEGSRHFWGWGRMSVSVGASTQAEDGMRLGDSITMRAPIGKDLPPEEEMAEKIRALAEDLTKRVSAPTPEDYTGPVLLEGPAAAQFFNSLFAGNLANPRIPLFENEMAARRFSEPALVGRLGKRVLPAGFEVIDDPTVKEWEGEALLGWYPVDDDGIQPQKVTLVEDGKLRNLLMSRIPTEKVTESNGHGRRSGGATVVGDVSNLFVKAAEGKTEEELKKAFLEMCEDEGLEYGILVRKNFSAGGGSRFGRGGASRLAAYRVYVEDGREEPTRGLRFRQVNVSALRDIAAAGEKQHVAHGRNGRSTIVAPSVLVEEMVLRKPPPQRDKGPYLPHPAFPD